MEKNLSLFIVFLIVLGYYQYVKNVLKGKTKPHAFSWLLWSMIAICTFFIQLIHKTGLVSYTTLFAGIVTFTISLLGFRLGDKSFNKSDKLLFTVGLIAVFFWLIIKEPLVSVILLCLINFLGFVPTLKKSWKNPHSETMFTWLICTFRYGIMLITIKQYSIITVLIPSYFLLSNGFFSLILFFRRKYIPNYESNF